MKPHRCSAAGFHNGPDSHIQFLQRERLRQIYLRPLTANLDNSTPAVLFGSICNFAESYPETLAVFALSHMALNMHDNERH